MHRSITLVLAAILFCIFPTDAGSPRIVSQICPGINASRSLCPDLPKTCCCKTGSLANEHINVKCTKLDSLPKNFPISIVQLALEYTTIEVLRETSLNRTQFSPLLDFTISYDDLLRRIEAKTFSGFRQLQTVTIEYVQSLTTISESAFQGAPNLRNVVLRETGLTRIQGFNGLTGPFERPLKITISNNHKLVKVHRDSFSNITAVELKITGAGMQLSKICRSAYKECIYYMQVMWWSCVDQFGKIVSNPNLKEVEDFAFRGSRVTTLVLNYNDALDNLQEHAFSGIDNFNELFLQQTAISSLPTTGMDSLSILDISDTANLVRFKTDGLPSLREAKVTYPAHCCALNKEYGFGTIFQSEDKDELVPCDADDTEIPEMLPILPHGDIISDLSTYDWNPLIDNESIIIFHDYSFTGEETNDLTDYAGTGDITSYNFGTDSSTDKWDSDPNNQPWRPATVSTENNGSATVTKMCYRDKNGTLREHVYRNLVKCSPQPDVFNPCENLLGHPGLVVVSWGVATLAVFGNFFVMFVLLAVAVDKSRTQQRHLSVPKFLILNLAFADLCMGIYVLALSAMDSKSSGEYYKFGVEWQAFGGCDVIGFLSVFSSQLSVYTLGVISLERWYAIRYAIQLDKRMTLKCGRIIMLVGWLLAILFATLPVVGVNSYKRTAVCLPMDVRTTSGTAYVAALLSLDIVAFVIVIGSYLSMYAIVRSANGLERGIKEFFKLRQSKKTDDSKPRTSHSGGEGCYGVMNSRKADARVAKRMAVLVFTDFACFFPICFFSLFALAGLPLLSMSTAKILLVACFPFNACCNPFLYAILTKSFRRDAKAFYKTHRHSLYGDDRQKARPTEKRSDGGSRQEERRKTIQVYVEGDQQNTNGDVALVSIDHKCVKNGSVSGKSPTRGVNHATCSLTTVKLADTVAKPSPDKSKHLPNHNNNNHNNNNAPKDPTHRVLTRSSTGPSSLDSDEHVAISKRLAMLALLRSFPMFKRRKRLGTDSSRQTYDTQVSANGAVVLFETRDAEPSQNNRTLDGEVVEMKSMVNEADLEQQVSHCEGESCI